MIDFHYDICAEFDCNPEYCRKHTGKDCQGKYWEPICIFHGEHLFLNVGEGNTEGIEIKK